MLANAMQIKHCVAAHAGLQLGPGPSTERYFVHNVSMK